jgi:hypothetical protein
MLALPVMALVQVASFRCKRQTELFCAAFEMLSAQPFGVAAAPGPPASMQQRSRAESHRIRFRPWLARCYGAVVRNAPARSQRDKNRLPRRASRDMKSVPRCELFRIQ